MRARRIIQTGAFDPTAVERLQNAFDLSWAKLSPTIAGADQERLRELLATIVVATGNVSGLDPEELAQVSIRSFEAIQEAHRSVL